MVVFLRNWMHGRRNSARVPRSAIGEKEPGNTGACCNADPRAWVFLSGFFPTQTATIGANSAGPSRRRKFWSTFAQEASARRPWRGSPSVDLIKFTYEDLADWPGAGFARETQARLGNDGLPHSGPERSSPVTRPEVRRRGRWGADGGE